MDFDHFELAFGQFDRSLHDVSAKILGKRRIRPACTGIFLANDLFGSGVVLDRLEEVGCLSHGDRQGVTSPELH